MEKDKKGAADTNKDEDKKQIRFNDNIIIDYMDTISSEPSYAKPIEREHADFNKPEQAAKPFIASPP